MRAGNGTSLPGDSPRASHLAPEASDPSTFNVQLSTPPPSGGGPGRLIAIGDIHGCADEFEALLAKLAPAQRAVNDIEFGGLSQSDFTQLHRIMGRLIENCDAALAMQRLLEQPATRGIAVRLDESQPA